MAVKITLTTIMAYKCNSCDSTSEEAKDCCDTAMVEQKEEASTEEATSETSTEGETSTE